MPKLEEKKKSKIVLLFLGLLLIKLGIALIVYKYISDKYSTFLEEKAIEEYYLDEKIFYESEKETVEEEKKLSTKKVDKINYIATIKIPKINLEKGLVEPSSDLNNLK